MYINTNTNEYPIYIGDIQILYPDFKEGDALPDGIFEVIETEMPQPTWENVVTLKPTPDFIDGKYYSAWDVLILTPEQVEERKVNELKMRAMMANLSNEDIVKLAASIE